MGALPVSLRIAPRTGEEGASPAFRVGTDTMVWEDPRTRISPEPTETYASTLAMISDGPCGTHADTAYGRRTQPNNSQSCVVPDGHSLGTISIPGVGDRQCMVSTIAAGGETFVTWLTPRLYSGSWQFSYPAGKEIIVEMWFQFASGTIGGAGTKWIELWKATHRTQVGVTSGSFGIGPWGYASPDDPLGNGLTARTPFYSGSGPGTVAYAADGNVHCMTIVYKPNSHTLAFFDGVLVIALGSVYAGVTPPGGAKPWCTATEVSGGQADDADILYTNFHDVFNSPASAAVIRTLPPRTWYRPTDFGP